MKIGDLIPKINFLTKIKIFTPDNDIDDPENYAYMGYILDMPWYFMDYIIAIEDDDIEEPIYIYIDEATNEPIMVINTIYEEG